MSHSLAVICNLVIAVVKCHIKQRNNASHETTEHPAIQLSVVWAGAH